MKNLKLKPGYLVFDWTGEVVPVYYTTVKKAHYGTEEECFLMFDKKDMKMREPITKWNSDKVFDSLQEAEAWALTKKRAKLEYFKERIEEYTSQKEELEADISENS